jgi:predicted ribosome quality control (RQC) complex YloA/Tae2 family protein
MEMKFKIDIRKSIPENADLYYSESKKAKKKAEGARKALEDTLGKIEKLEKEREGLIEKLQAKPRKREKKRGEWYESFRWFLSSDNFLAIGGKDAATNELLIKKYLEKDDLVFHADVQGAPFFVIKNSDGKEIPEGTLKETAEMAASYSKAWKSNLGSCDVYYVKPEQLSKKAPAGEYVAKGAFMIHGKKEWFRGTELGVGIGFKVNERAEIVAGPVSVVEKNSTCFVRIGPGDKKSKQLAKEIRDSFLRNAGKGDYEKIERIGIEEIQRWIPGGKGRVKK